MHSPVRASEAVISLDRIRSLLANASGRVEFYTPASVNNASNRLELSISVDYQSELASKKPAVQNPHCLPHSGKSVTIRESNHDSVYIRSKTCSAMYQKAPFC